VESDASFWSGLTGILTAIAAVLTALATLVGALYTAGMLKPGMLGRSAPAQSAVPQDVLRLRDAPGELSVEHLDLMLVERDFHDRERHPAGRGLAHRYETRALGDTLVIVDTGTRLMWERGGSEVALSSEAASAYIAKLNKRCHAGFSDWRLPTAEEASSLVEPRAGASAQISDAFGTDQRFLWTADHAPDGRVWVLYACAGHLSREAQQFNAWVKAVRSTAERWATERPVPSAREGAEGLSTGLAGV